jgi:hypothetical protein
MLSWSGAPDIARDILRIGGQEANDETPGTGHPG